MDMDELFGPYEGLDPDEAARRIVPLLDHDDVWHLARYAFVVWRRNQVRQVERTFVASRPGGRARYGDPVPYVSHTELMKRSFFVPSKGYVQYGDSTIADHEERIAYLTAKMNGIGETIGLHRYFIAEMQRLHVAVLGEMFRHPEARVPDMLPVSD